MVGEQTVADTEATEADRANTCLPALRVEVDAPGQRTPAGTGATSLRTHTGQANAAT
jgi:hypothetical protein